MRLYDIAESILSILGEEDAELTPESEQALAALEMEFEAKAEAILKYRQGLQAEYEALCSEADRLKKNACQRLAKSERLKDVLYREMKRINVPKLRTQTFSASICKSPPKVEVEDVDALPDFLINTTIEPKKSEILRHWKEVEGAKANLMACGVTITEGEHLRIT